MKIIITLIVLTYSLNAVSQTDTLSKYTYFLGGVKIIGNSDTLYPIGSCFFVRQDGILILVTAKHNITHINTFDKTQSGRYFDTVAFRYFNIDSNKYCINLIDIRETKNRLLNKYYYEDADIAFIGILAGNISKSIYSIENIISRPYDEDVNKYNLICYGYGIDIPNDFKLETPPILYEGLFADIFHFSTADVPNNNIYYKTQPKSIQGLSGAPVFYSYLKNSKWKITFGGLMFGANIDSDYAYVVSPDLIRDYISKIHIVK